jgi:asparagine synthase (glutamine-hydrolysing)
MCGINGIAIPRNSARALDAATLARMRDTLSHRGPDDCGIYLDASGRIGLGHRRLSIVDVASGHQPMKNEDDSCVIVYNGEIYNHADFRAELEARGHLYRTHCDTETILHLYEERERGAVENLRGMFAFAIWDERKRELLLTRDRLGVKPLYFVHAPDGSLYFASEIKSLLEARAVKPEINFAVLSDYLANHATSGEETLFVGVRRLLPGHALRWSEARGEIHIEKYWDISYANDAEQSSTRRSDAEFIKEWLELFETSVRLRLMADVPLGMFLSGGIDSSAIAAMMSRMVSEPIKTFSVAFKEREANELEYARIVARAFKTDHHEITVTPEQFFDALPQLVWHEDEPIAHPSSVALYFVSKLAAQHVKVVLTGEGSDELLAGYARYCKTILNLSLGARYHKLTNENLRALVRRVLEISPANARLKQKFARTFLYLAPDIENIYFDNFAVFNRAQQATLLSDETKERMGSGDPYTKIRQLINSSDADTLLNKLLYADAKTYLHELLMKQDQMSMAASIESRVPFLDHKLVEYTSRLPEHLKLRGATTKRILREAMRDILPPEILTRRKMGFPVPVGAWFRGAYRKVVDEYVLSERALSRGIFKPEAVRETIARHAAGENHDERIWALVNFEIWQRRFIDGEAASERETSAIETVALV